MHGQRGLFHIRQYHRVGVHCRLYFSTNQLRGTGTVWNLSVGGWRMDTDLPLIPGTRLKLFVMLPDGAPPIVVEQAIVYWRRGPDMGLSTRHMTAPQIAWLTAFITSRMAVLV